MVKFVFKLCIVFFHIKAFAISLYGYKIINGYFHPTQLAFSICCFLRSSLEGWELDLATTFFFLFFFSEWYLATTFMNVNYLSVLLLLLLSFLCRKLSKC